MTEDLWTGLRHGFALIGAVSLWVARRVADAANAFE